MNKPTTKPKRITGRALTARRARIWQADPRCAMCHRLTDFPGGFELDHRIPLHLGGPETDENCQVLCIDDHQLKSRREHSEWWRTNQGYASEQKGAAYPEWMPSSDGLCSIVFGPPGSGKSTYVEQNAKPTDRVIDLDYIKATISGKPIYHADDDIVGSALFERNSMLASIAQRNVQTWFIATGVGEPVRQWWREKLKPSKTVVLNVEANECIRRINADPRRPDRIKEIHARIVWDWWRAEQSPHTIDKPNSVSIAKRRVIGVDGLPVDA